MRVAAIQHTVCFENAEATRAHVTPLIADAAVAGARLVVLTEMFATGFSMNPERIAEVEGGPSERFLLDQAALHDVYLIASIAQRGTDGKYRNNAVVASPDGSVQRYAKIHPFSYAREDEHYTAGEQFLTVELDGVRVSIFVCYDLRFADEFWVRALETDLYVVVANWPQARREHWRALLRARAIENQAYVVGVNAVGTINAIDYSGDSVIVDPLGVEQEAGPAECILDGDVSAEVVTDVRRRFPFLADRR
jgi:predicted amidohydrolase